MASELYRIPSKLPWTSHKLASDWESIAGRFSRLWWNLRDNWLSYYWHDWCNLYAAAAGSLLHGDNGYDLEEDIVYPLMLHVEGVKAAPPSQASLKARALLELRRMLVKPPYTVRLTLETLTDLANRHQRLRAGFLDQLTSEGGATHQDWPTRERFIHWLKVLDELRPPFPPLAATAVALQAWQSIEPLPYANTEVGCLLAANFLKGTSFDQTPFVPLALGYMSVGVETANPDQPFEKFLASFFKALGSAIGSGHIFLTTLLIGDEALEKYEERQKWRRKSKKAHFYDLARAILWHPLVSPRIIAKRLNVSVKVAEKDLKRLEKAGVLYVSTHDPLLYRINY